jgi:hypothetical protein
LINIKFFLPFLVHFIVGFGFPETKQLNSALVPSIISKSAGFCKNVGET